MADSQPPPSDTVPPSQPQPPVQSTSPTAPATTTTPSAANPEPSNNSSASTILTDNDAANINTNPDTDMNTPDNTTTTTNNNNNSMTTQPDVTMVDDNSGDDNNNNSSRHATAGAPAPGFPINAEINPVAAAPTLPPSKKDTSLREFLGQMDEYAPIIPDAVTAHYLTLAGLPPPGNGPNHTPPHLARLLALATQKFVADIAADAYQYSRIRSSNSSSSNNPMGSINLSTGLAQGVAGAGGGAAGSGAAGVGAGGGAGGGGGGGADGGKGKGSGATGLHWVSKGPGLGAAVREASRGGLF
ncbi:hypothetical protein ACJ72_05448 [Emergomyces africanus]|uniref:Transcription initiation factor TFIID subunit 10 n=1 Tax=Emergomyces africanus TaxID=1955775 RepID=A0A1B7NTX2_9EURO|nr:hypothetical protein ACJ72_05448 [Emergomyces africanus]